MTGQTPLEQKRAEARRYAGVTYDSRIARFTAAITIDGVKKHLGSFMAAELASAAYKEARAAHPVYRPRSNADSIRQRMIDFTSAADYHENILLPGQIFTAPDGQRFRVEGVDRYKKQEWYVWSAPCRACGALFEQFVSINLGSVVSLTRNCPQHHGVRDAEIWPDPFEWATAPRVFALKPSTTRSKLSQANATDITEHGGVEYLPGNWSKDKIKFVRALKAENSNVTTERAEALYESAQAHRRENPPTAEEIRSRRAAELVADFPAPWRANEKLFVFARGYRMRFPDSDLSEIMEKFHKHQHSISARDEDAEALAVEPAKDNSDLV